MLWLCIYMPDVMDNLKDALLIPLLKGIRLQMFLIFCVKLFQISGPRIRIYLDPVSVREGGGGGLKEGDMER